MGCPGYCVKCGCNPTDSYSTDSLARVWCPDCTDAVRLSAVPPKHPALRDAIEKAIALAKEAGLTGEHSVQSDLETALRGVEPRASSAEDRGSEEQS